MKKSLVILMIALVAISLFVGCNEPGIKSYTVTFETGNETVIEPQTVVEGGKVSKPSDLTKTGYTFGGWYDGEIEFDFSTAITKNYDLKAKWTLNTYQVTFDSDGGTPASYDAKNVNYNGTITEPTAPTKTGYTFDCWYDGDTKFDFTTAITKNYALKAKWTLNTYQVTFDSDGGTPASYDAKNVNYNGTITAPTQPTKTGYTFGGWYDGDTKFDFTTAITKNYALKAKWTLNTYQVTFDSDGGSPASYEAKSANYNETITAPTQPTKTGYTFQDWYEGDTKFDFTTAITKNYALKAKWTLNTYQVTFDSDGGTPASYDAKNVNYNCTITEPTAPTKTGYTFQGWYDGDTKFDFTTAITKNYALKAKWNINSFTVSFNSDGGTPTSYDSKNVNYNGTITEPTAPTKTGYTFQGWYDGDTKFEFTTAITKNYALKAKWRVLATYTVTFNVDGVTTTVSAQTVTEGGTASEPTTTPTKSGWIFDHWAKEENGSTAFDFTTSINANTTIYAVFRNYYKVGDTGPAGGTIIYDCDADNTTEDADGADNLKSDVCGWRYLEAAPTDAPNGSTAQQYSWGPEENYATGTAIGDGWKNAAIFMDEVGYPNTFPSAKACDDYSVTVDGVTYDDWYLPSIAELQLVYNNREKVSGYIANGNYCSSSSAVCDGRYIAVWVIDKGSKDMRTRSGSRYIRPIRAFLTAGTTNPPVVENPTAKYTVTFNLNDGNDTTYTSITVKEGKTVSKPSNPTKDGYIFTKWTTDAGGNNEYEFTSTVSGSFTLYAQWKTVNIGDTGPGGGIVFYIAPELQTSTYTDNDGQTHSLEWKYLEVAQEDQSHCDWIDGAIECSVSTGTAVGSGWSNTKLLALDDTCYYPAVMKCTEYSNNGYSDWFLPSKEEFKLIRTNIYDNYSLADEIRQKFQDPTEYWTSSTASSTNVYYGKFMDRDLSESSFSDMKMVRPIRAFK